MFGKKKAALVYMPLGRTSAENSIPIERHKYVSTMNDDPVAEKPNSMLAVKGFRIELGGTDERFDAQSVRIEDTEKHSLYYKKHFLNTNHLNWVGGTELDPAIVSIKSDLENGEFRTIVRTKKDDYLGWIKGTGKEKKEVLLKFVQSQFPDIAKMKLKFIKDVDFPRKMLYLEDRLLIKQYRIGILYCKEGQTEENDMFSNETGGKRFEAFLNMIGDRVELKGYTGFKGGLDVDNNATGTQSVATSFHDFEIMFHVSTLLPYSTHNRQQLERKRHIGNDVNVIIFQDAPTPFSPKTISSKFNHNFVLVQYLPELSKQRKTTMYSLAVASKGGVESFGPPLPKEPVFTKSNEFRELLLTKLVNAERAAYYAPGFSVSRTRRLWFKEMLKAFG